MDYENIIKDLENKIYKPLYLFYGEESYFIDELTNYIAHNVLTESEKAFNQTIVYGKDVKAAEIIEMAMRYPMMSNLQVIIVKEAQGIKNFKDFEPYVANPAKSTILVFNFKYTRSIDKRLKVNTLIGKNGLIFESKKLYENQVHSWISSSLKKDNLTIHPEAIRLLYESVGSDLSLLTNELKKLIISLKPGISQIQKDDVANNIGINRNFNIFELQKALGAKDKLTVYKIFDYFGRDPKTNPLIVTIARLFDYFSKIILFHSLTDKSKGNIAANLGINPYFVDEYRNAAANYPINKVINIISYLKECDLKLKGVGATNPDESGLSKELVYKILH
ncbi:MAG: DNA polymerase III subunit delta [Bacteroidales bacterium]|jgi:DNA polymerase-3 subunit delta|nr:DNA polymerase III subunit delta [Bacteroidales bacterium]